MSQGIPWIGRYGPLQKIASIQGIEQAQTGQPLRIEAGGVAVWAHPFWDVEADPEVIATLERFKGLGLDGVEAFYVTHTQVQTDLLVERAGELDLLTTGSSDYHGPNHRQFNRFGAFSTFGHRPNLGPIAA